MKRESMRCFGEGVGALPYVMTLLEGSGRCDNSGIPARGWTSSAEV
jgi:hypothetical protein